MKQFLSIGTAVLLAAHTMAAMNSNTNREINRLLSSMSLDEKIGQMVQLDLLTVTKPDSSPIRLDPDKLREALVTRRIGSLINNGVNHALTLDEWVYVNKTIQDLIRAETPRKIPLLYGIDSIHGATYVLDSTLFPQHLGMAATRNPELIRRCAEISALERAAGLRWTFAPVLDVGRQPLWPRFAETFGEDPYLASVLGVAEVRGFQEPSERVPVKDSLRIGDLVTLTISGADPGPFVATENIKEDGTIPIPEVGRPVTAVGKTVEQLRNEIAGYYRPWPSWHPKVEVQATRPNRSVGPLNVAACLKHYLGYSFPFNGKDRSPALIPDSYLREYFLPPFREAVKAGAKTVMVNSGEINGVPVHGSKYLLTDVLRGELGFQGVIVSDWEDIKRLHTWQHVAETPADAVKLALDAGLDMSMVPLDYSFADLLKQLVRDKKVSEKRIDESVRRILQLKYDLGLFANPYAEPEARKQFGKPEYRQAALEAAEESLTLLKNENAALPLKKSAKVLVTGPAAKSISALHGCWSYTWQGTDEKWYPKGTLTIVDAIGEKIGAQNVLYRKGSDFDGKLVELVDFDAAVADAAGADAIILCLGEDAYAETPGDLNDLNLPASQQELAKRLYATGKPVVLVLVEGRGRVIREIEPGARGIVLAYWPGSQGARAIANVLFGDANPSGKLPFTYARYPNHLVTYDRKLTDRIDEDSPPEGHQAIEYRPQWEFGDGLSYTTFACKNLKLSAPVLRGNGKLTVTVDVANTGSRPGKETIELYTRDLYASLTPPLKRLRAFQKASLAPGQTTTVSFDLRASDLAFVNGSLKLLTEPGEFEVMVGGMKATFRFEK